MDPLFVTISAHLRVIFHMTLPVNMCYKSLIKMTPWFSIQRMTVAAILLVLMQTMPVSAADEFTLDTARQAAKQGNAQAEYFLAKHYEKGDGLPQDYAAAAGYLRQAAEQGLANAQSDLGAFFANGLGVKQDDQEAIHWFRKAAKQGDALAQYILGLCYAEGRGVATNFQESVKWYRQAANQKQPDALLALGDIYLIGKPGVPADHKAAGQCYRQAAAQGRLNALNSLGYIYENGGAGVDQNYELAMKFYRTAAEKNDAAGQMNLGLMYMEGTGVKTDQIAAYQWLYLAAHNGSGIAKHYLAQLEGRDPLSNGSGLTKPQIEEAIRRANQFKASMINNPTK
jgi:hypothetical protein